MTIFCFKLYSLVIESMENTLHCDQEKNETFVLAPNYIHSEQKFALPVLPEYSPQSFVFKTSLSQLD